ncbi:hypothetical protein KUCAC02_029651 [Chaenocephalus aceratus]|nr:hypothetical protein KUCAC02_029651 [Chaenocephalus aceratus]
MATPLLRILNPQAPGDRQQAVAVPSKEARCYRDKGKAFPTPPVELLSEATAMAKAEKLLRAKADPCGVDRNVVRLLRDRTEGNTMEKVWRQTFQAPPAHKQLPTARLLRHAFLLAEANNVQDYRSQILSTFGTVMKMDSTKKAVKKLSGQGRGSAEWFTSIGNEYSQIVSFVLTCEESAQKLLPMCRGVMDRFRLANQPVPKILYIDRGCCRAMGPTAVETMFQEWFDGGMVVRLDIFHWIHRFDAAIRTDAHSKYAVFKSALAGAVLAYNRTDLELLIEAGSAATQQTFRLIHLAIEELKGPAGLDQSGVTLFKTPAAIDEMWVGQQRRLECIQDPPGMIMYRVARTTTINGVDLPYYKSLRGSNSLEGFHKSLPHMIPGKSPFGETVEENFRAPAEVDSHELLGLEDLFSQSTGESGPFSLEDIIHDGPGPDEEVVQPGQPTPDPEADEAYQSDGESHCEGDHVLDAILPHITDETSSVNPPAFEDACSQNPLPGYPQLERFCSHWPRVVQDALGQHPVLPH